MSAPIEISELLNREFISESDAIASASTCLSDEVRISRLRTPLLLWRESEKTQFAVLQLLLGQWRWLPVDDQDPEAVEALQRVLEGQA